MRLVAVGLERPHESAESLRETALQASEMEARGRPPLEPVGTSLQAVLQKARPHLLSVTLARCSLQTCTLACTATVVGDAVQVRTQMDKRGTSGVQELERALR